MYIIILINVKQCWTCINIFWWSISLGTKFAPCDLLSLILLLTLKSFWNISGRHSTVTFLFHARRRVRIVLSSGGLCAEDEKWNYWNGNECSGNRRRVYFYFWHEFVGLDEHRTYFFDRQFNMFYSCSFHVRLESVRNRLSHNLLTILNFLFYLIKTTQNRL